MQKINTLGILLAIVLSNTAFAAPVQIESDLVSTCFEKSNTAVVAALKNSEQKVQEQCATSELLSLETLIKPGSCGFVQVVATYDCK